MKISTLGLEQIALYLSAQCTDIAALYNTEQGFENYKETAN